MNSTQSTEECTDENRCEACTHCARTKVCDTCKCVGGCHSWCGDVEETIEYPDFTAITFLNRRTIIIEKAAMCDSKDEFESDSEDEFESDSKDEFESDSEDEFESDSEDELGVNDYKYIVYGFYERWGFVTNDRTFNDLNDAREYYNILINNLKNEYCDEIHLDELDEDGDMENLDCHRFESDSEGEEDEFESDSEDEEDTYTVYGQGKYGKHDCISRSLVTHDRIFTDLNEAREYYNVLINDLKNECDGVYLDTGEDGDIENLDCHRFESDSED